MASEHMLANNLSAARKLLLQVGPRMHAGIDGHAWGRGSILGPLGPAENLLQAPLLALARVPCWRKGWLLLLSTATPRVMRTPSPHNVLCRTQLRHACHRYQPPPPPDAPSCSPTLLPLCPSHPRCATSTGARAGCCRCCSPW